MPSAPPRVSATRPTAGVTHSSGRGPLSRLPRPSGGPSGRSRFASGNRRLIRPFVSKISTTWPTHFRLPEGSWHACPGFLSHTAEGAMQIRLVVRGLVHPRRHRKEIKIGIHAARKRRRFRCEPRLKSLPIEHEWHAPMQILCAITSAGRDDGEG